MGILQDEDQTKLGELEHKLIWQEILNSLSSNWIIEVKRDKELMIGVSILIR